MTSMDTDSESQDSDDGRRFRFEATRKDATTVSGTVSKERSPKKKSKRRSHLEEKDYHDRKEKTKHDSSRKESRHSKERNADGKDSKHITKHTKYGTHKDYRGTRERDSASSEKNIKYSMDFKDRTRDFKHSRERDRSNHRKHSRERSRDRSYDDKSSVDRHRSKYYDRHKYHSRNKSHDRSCQSTRLKSLDNNKSRGEHEKHEPVKKTINKRLQHLGNEHDSHKNFNQLHDTNESHLMSLDKIGKTATSLNVQDCEDLDLSDFDVLSETDENISDISDTRSQCSSSYYHKTKVRKEHSKNQYECVNKKHLAPDQEHIEGLQKVNSQNSIPLSSSGNNNSSAISDTLLDSTALESTSVMNKQVKSLQETDAKYESSVKADSYGPMLPPQLETSQSNVQESTNGSTSSYMKQHETEKDIEDTSNKDNTTTVDFIGPCLPNMECISNDDKNIKDANSHDLKENDKECEEMDSHSPQKDINESLNDSTATFGPALPPHLMKPQQSDNDTKSRFIGPTIPEDIKLLTEEERMAMYSQMEDEEDTLRSSPIHHSTTGNGQAYQELQTPGLHYFHEIKQEVANDVVHKREKWMMELPPTRAADFGLRARKFRLRPGPDMSDRSCWTDTPIERAQKQEAEEKAAALRSLERSDNTEILKDKSKKTKKREKSLLEIHQSKLKKKKKKEEKEAKAAGLPTRRPFDRTIDLQVNRFMDHSQKRSILMKAEMLDDRFSRGQI